MARKTITNPAAEQEDAPVLSRRQIIPSALIAAQSAEVAEPVESGKTVTVRIPRDFILTLDDHTQAKYPAGVDEMPIEHANHWYAKVMGVEIYDQKKSR